MVGLDFSGAIYGAPFSQGMPLTGETMLQRVEAGAGNLLANPRFAGARYVDADNATFPWWTTTGNADASVEGKLVLDPGEYAEQELFEAFGTDGWEEQELSIGMLLSVADPDGQATISVVWDVGAADGVVIRQTDLPSTVGVGWRALVGPANAVSATVRIENTGTVGAVDVYLAHFGPGQMLRVPAHPAATEPVQSLGVLTGSTVTNRGGMRMMRIEDIRFTPTAASSTATATVGLTAVGPAGLFVTGDVAHAAVSMDDTSTMTTRTSQIFGTVSGVTLTITAVAHNGLTYVAQPIVCSAVVFVYPAASLVASRGASKRAYPYG